MKKDSKNVFVVSYYDNLFGRIVLGVCESLGKVVELILEDNKPDVAKLDWSKLDFGIVDSVDENNNTGYYEWQKMTLR